MPLIDSPVNGAFKWLAGILATLIVLVVSSAFALAYSNNAKVAVIEARIDQHSKTLDSHAAQLLLLNAGLGGINEKLGEIRGALAAPARTRPSRPDRDE